MLRTQRNRHCRVVTEIVPCGCVDRSAVHLSQIILMLELLCVPDRIRTDCGYVLSGRTALCILLYRMAFPCRYKDMRVIFHLPDSLLCEAFNYMLHFMDETWGPLLTLDIGRLVPQLEVFVEALQAWGCPLPNCWAFIDGTVRGICRCVCVCSSHFCFGLQSL